MNVKFIAKLTAAAGTGAAWAWAITADRAEEKARRMADDYIQLISDAQSLIAENVHLTTQLASANDRIDTLEHRLTPDINDSEVSLKDVAESIPEANPEPTDEELAVQKTALQTLIAPYVGNPEAQEAFVEQARVAVASASQDPPFVISQSDYSHDEEGQDYAKHTVHFYGKHQTLLDEDDEVVPQNEVEGFVGWRSLRRFGDMSNQPDVVYVRNRRLEVDFEVVLLEDEDLPLHAQYNMDKPTFETMKRSGKLLLPGAGDDEG